jgi:hypothetical protein
MASAPTSPANRTTPAFTTQPKHRADELEGIPSELPLDALLRTPNVPSLGNITDEFRDPSVNVPSPAPAAAAPAKEDPAALAQRKNEVAQAILQVVMAQPPKIAFDEMPTVNAIDDAIARAGSLDELNLIEAHWQKAGVRVPSMPVPVITKGGMTLFVAVVEQFRTQGRLKDQDGFVAELAAAQKAAGISEGFVISGEKKLPTEVAQRLGNTMKDLWVKDGWGNYVYRPEKIRKEAQQEIFDALDRNPLVREAKPVIEKILDEQDENLKAIHISRQDLLDPVNMPANFNARKYNKVVLEAVQEIASEFGFKSVDVYVKQSPQPNAYVYTANEDHAAVVIHSSLIDPLVEKDTGQWLKRAMDPVTKKWSSDLSKGEVKEAGKKVLASVVGHELGHIKDKISYYDFVMYQLLRFSGVNVFEPEKSERAVPEAMYGQLREAGRSMVQSIAGFNPTEEDFLAVQRTFEQGYQDLSQTYPATPDIATRTLREIAGTLPGLEDISHGNGEMSVTDLAYVVRRIMAAVGRSAESTADRYAVVQQGTEYWDGVMTLIFALGNDLDQAMAVNPQEFAQERFDMLRTGKKSTVDVAQEAQGSHPAGFVRIRDGYQYAREKDGTVAKIQELKHLDGDLQGVAMMQVLQRRLDRILDEVREDPTEELDTMIGWVEHDRSKDELSQLKSKFDNISNAVMAEVTKAGLANPENPVLDRALTFLSKGGALIADGTYPMSFGVALVNAMKAEMPKASPEGRAVLKARLETVVAGMEAYKELLGEIRKARQELEAQKKMFQAMMTGGAMPGLD